MKHVILLTFLMILSTVAANAQGPREVGLPEVIHECDIVGTFAGCSDWSISGKEHYSGHGADGSLESITVVHFYQDDVLMERSDSNGTNAGLKGVYKGKIEGNQIVGTFTTNNSGYTLSGKWKATLEGTFPAGGKVAPKGPVGQEEGAPSERTAPSDPSRLSPQSTQALVQFNRILKTHGHSGQVPAVTTYAEGPASIICMYARQDQAKPDDPPAKCDVAGPGLASVLAPEDKLVYTSESGEVTLRCTGVGEVSCSVRLRITAAKPK